MNHEFNDRIKSESNIADVIGDYIKLRKAGINYKGCCPFHQEATPSFVVSPNKGIYTCFGCGKHGDVISFVQEHENISYTEALRILAKRANIDMPEVETSDEDRKRMLERESLLNINAAAWAQMRQNITTNPEALSYAMERGYTAETISKFGIGYAESNNQLTSTFSATQQKLAQKLGIIKEGERGKYDAFRQRLMFAFQDLNGNIIGFAGRHTNWVKGESNFGKWINSDDSELFHKEKAVFGLFQAKKEISRRDKALVVEGQGDVATLHQAGIEITVAGSGTAIGKHQARLIIRFSKNVVLMYDGDAAGQKATLSAINVFLAEGASVRIITLPETEDPDSFVRKQPKKDLYKTLSEMERGLVEYFHHRYADQLSDPQKKTEVLLQLGETLSNIEDDLLRNSYIQQVCVLFEVGIDDFKPKTKAKKKEVKTDTWKDGFHGVDEARAIAKSDTITLSFNQTKFIEDYDFKAVILAKGNIGKHHIQSLHTHVRKVRVDMSEIKFMDDKDNEGYEAGVLKEMFRHGFDIEVEYFFNKRKFNNKKKAGEDDIDEDWEEEYTSGFADYYVNQYAIYIDIRNKKLTETEKTHIFNNCAEVISFTDVTARTVSMKTWAKRLDISGSDLKAIVLPFLNRRKDKAALENQRLNEASDLLEFNPEEVPSYVDEDKTLSQIYKRDHFFPILKKTKEEKSIPVAYMFRNEKGGGHSCISDFYMEPLLHIAHKDSAMNKRVIQLNHMHLPTRYVEWQSSFMANLGKLNEKFIEEGSYNFEGTANQWRVIWRNMSYNFITCTELRTFGQQPEEFWAWSNAILHEVDGETKVEHTTHLGVVTHKEQNYYSPAFSQIFANNRDGNDQYEQDRFFIYKDIPEAQKINFKDWASLVDQVYKVNDNGKWAVLFDILACFRDYIYSQKKFFTTLFFIGPAGSGKTELARSMRSLFMSPDAPVFNLNSGTDAAFFMVLERLRNVICIMEEYNDTGISQAKFQGLKSAVFDGEGKIKVKDINSKTLDSSKINAIPLPLGQEAPQQDDGSLAMRCIICEVPYKDKGEFSQEETQLFDTLKLHERTGLCNVLVEILSVRNTFKNYFLSTFAEEVKRIKEAVSDKVSNTEGLTRVENAVALVTSVCRIIEERTELKLPFTYAEFFPMATDKVLKQMEQISTSNKLQNFFGTLSFLLNQGKIRMGKEMKVDATKGGIITVMKQGKVTEQVKLPTPETRILFLDMSSIYPLYSSVVKDALTKSSLTTYFKSHSCFIGLSKATVFSWDEAHEVRKEIPDGATDIVDRKMKKQTNTTSAYMFNYDDLADLMNISFVRETEEEDPQPGEDKPTDLPF